MTITFQEFSAWQSTPGSPVTLKRARQTSAQSISCAGLPSREDLLDNRHRNPTIMISVSQAIQIVREQTRLLPTEPVALQDAPGRILAEDIVADSDLPPFDRAQMDGYAVRADEVANTPARLRIVGESAAGAGWHHQMKAGEAVRIMTGAPVPAGADAVQQVELTREVDGGSQVEILEPVDAGRSIVKQAAEIKSGETVLRAGEDINAAMIAMLASFGYAQIKVGRRPRVAVMATGSELVAVDRKPGKDQIRDS